MSVILIYRGTISVIIWYVLVGGTVVISASILYYQMV